MLTLLGLPYLTLGVSVAGAAYTDAGATAQVRAEPVLLVLLLLLVIPAQGQGMQKQLVFAEVFWSHAGSRCAEFFMGSESCTSYALCILCMLTWTNVQIQGSCMAAWLYDNAWLHFC